MLLRTCRVHPECLIGCDGFVSAFVFAVATQQTIGASVQPSATRQGRQQYIHRRARGTEGRGTRGNITTSGCAAVTSSVCSAPTRHGLPDGLGYNAITTCCLSWHRPWAVRCLAVGYGDVSPNNCWVANWVIVVQSIFALLLNAIVMGVIFARISRCAQCGVSGRR